MASRETPSILLGPEEELVGTLQVSEQGCVVLVTDKETLIVWAPAGARLTDGGERVSIPGRDAVALGDRVTLSGKVETVGLPIRPARPLNYEQCVPKSQRRAARMALVADVPNR